MCPGSLDRIYIVPYYIKRVKTAWTYNIRHERRKESVNKCKGNTAAQFQLEIWVMQSNNSILYIYTGKMERKNTQCRFLPQNQ